MTFDYTLRIFFHMIVCEKYFLNSCSPPSALSPFSEKRLLLTLKAPITTGRRHFQSMFYVVFRGNNAWHLHVNRLLGRQFTCNVKHYFLWKIRNKNRIFHGALRVKGKNWLSSGDHMCFMGLPPITYGAIFRELASSGSFFFHLEVNLN